ncbi:hypothetical protein LA080_000216 [Diaporthe eres]|uniref:Uncharacterized protein n=1 Tax=Diaporthe vaccinii TaxID=105482 RepID=A0ABR4DV25_9PEZI|nr:hypothetical protein LA080_000216 [Diaporthe eres]
MTMFASGEVVPAQPSQESHLLSPETSAAGSDNGQLEDLKGETFSELVEERHSLAKEAGAVAATPYHHEQTQLKTPASLANPGTCSTSTTTTTGKSKTTTPQATQKPRKSNNAKMSAKAALSASRRATPINIQIVRLAASSSAPPSSSSSSSSSTANKTKGSAPQEFGLAHAFTMNMLPMTKIRELCLHAAGHARRNFDVVLDGSRFEARDRDGHVFQGHETLSEEILSGETIYLVEGGLDARGAAKAVRGSAGANEKPKSTSRERGRLLCLKSLELEGEEMETKTPYRTPSVSSRASSSRSDSKGKAGQPRLTASQKALAIARMGRTPTPQEPVLRRKVPTSSAVKKSLPSPALEKVGEATDEEVRDEGAHVGETAEIDDLEVNLVAASPLRSPSPPPQRPQPQTQQHTIPTNLQDSQLVIPDSQDPFSQGLFSQEPVEPGHPAPAIPTPDTSDTQKAQSRPSPRVKTTTAQPKLQMSRPDPYDINTVLSDEDDERSDESNTNTTANIKMSSSVRKLGSATAQRRAVVPPPVSLPSPRRHQSGEVSPSRANKEAILAVCSKTSTPTKKATPIKAGPSSPAVPLPSSPTTRVAAAIAKGGQRTVGKNRQPSLPSPGQIVYRVPSDSESDDDLIEEAFRDLSSSIPTPSLPWSAPPLRAAPDAETDAVNQPSASRSPVGSRAGNVKYGTSMADEVSIVGVSPRKSPLKSPLKKPLGQSPSPGKKSSEKSPSKKPIITSPSKREEATIVHDSSDADESDNEGDVQIVKKEPPSSEKLTSSKTKLADIPPIDENSQHMEKIQPEVIELSSGSDSDIESSADMLEDDEAELPSIDVELLTEKEQLPPLPRSPAQADRSPTQGSPQTESIKTEPACKEAPPSAQTSKRKRTASEEPDLESEQHKRKRLKREAKKAGWKRNREQRNAMLPQEESETQLAALQKERKKLALERAHRRALELEMIVSSPIKRESSIDLSEEADDDDSGLGSSAYGDGAGAQVDRAGVPLDGDDKNDSLSSKEADGHQPSWRKLSKLHLSSSPPKGSQGGPGQGQDSMDMLPPTSTPAIIEAQLQQCVEERFHRMPFDDWAFLENTLGKGSSGGFGYSPLEVHNRVHLDMMHRAQLPPPRVSGGRESSNAPAMAQIESESTVLPSQAGDDDARSQRSEAPSPKEHRASEGEEQEPVKAPEELPKESRREDERAMAEKKAKTRLKLRSERDRKKQRRRMANGRYHHDFRVSCAGSKKMKKQRHKQKDHWGS